MKSPLPRILAPLTVPASWMYGAAIARRNARFNRGVGVQRIDRPVISVGNITTGGTGKTPMVMHIARLLREAGHHPVIAMRGYRAIPGALSDEQAEYAEVIPEVPVLANPDRIDALRRFLPDNPAVDCVILDDGFQHRQLHRDLDLVLIDAQAGTFNGRLLPAGQLREPLANLKRADAVVVTRAETEIPNLKTQIEEHHGGPPQAWSRHRWTHLEIHNRETCRRRENLAWLGGKRVLTMLGVGNPDAIIRQVETNGGEVAVNIPAGDHEEFDRAKIATTRGLCEACEAMVVTGKDWVKLRNLIDLPHWPVPIVVPRMEIEVFVGAVQLCQRVLGVFGRPPANPHISPRAERC